MQIVFTWDRAAAGQNLCSQSRAAPAQPVTAEDTASAHFCLSLVQQNVLTHDEC